MLQASCIYLGFVTPYLETYHPLHPPRRLITPCPTTCVISTKEYSKYPAWLTFPLSLPQTSLQVWSLPDPILRSAWSLGRLSPLLAWIKVTYFCWGRLSFSASPELYLTFLVLKPGLGRGTCLTLSLSLPLILFPFSQESGSANILRAHFSARALKFPSGRLVPWLYRWFVYPQASALPPFLSLSDDLQNRDLLPFNHSTCNTPRKPAPRLR